VAKRSYGQYCALARTLDLIGERWTLLVIRELAAGPKRYSDLLDALPGVGTSLLADRLKHLEAKEIIRRRTLPPPAASTVYELFGAGAELARALLPLTVWGVRHALGPRRRSEAFRAEWPLLAIGALIDKSDTVGVSAVYEFRIDDSVGHLRVENGAVSAHAGEAPDGADVVVVSDVETFVGIPAGRTDPATAMADGRLVLEGEPDAIEVFLRLMPIDLEARPTDVPAQPATRRRAARGPAR
jgi:DNA-binding HxlR family transcriptional regulator